MLGQDHPRHCIGIADGMSIARVQMRRCSKRPPRPRAAQWCRGIYSYGLYSYGLGQEPPNGAVARAGTHAYTHAYTDLVCMSIRWRERATRVALDGEALDVRPVYWRAVVPPVIILLLLLSLDVRTACWRTVVPPAITIYAITI